MIRPWNAPAIIVLFPAIWLVGLYYALRGGIHPPPWNHELWDDGQGGLR